MMSSYGSTCMTRQVRKHESLTHLFIGLSWMRFCKNVHGDPAWTCVKIWHESDYVEMCTEKPIEVPSRRTLKILHGRA